MYVDVIGIKLFRNLSTLNFMNSFFLGDGGGGKIGLELAKSQNLSDFSLFFNLDTFS